MCFSSLLQMMNERTRCRVALSSLLLRPIWGCFMCVRTQSVNSKLLPHLKGIRKDGTSLQLDNKIKAKITTSKIFFFFFQIKQMNVSCIFGLFYLDGANAVRVDFLQWWPCPRDNTWFPSIYWMSPLRSALLDIMKRPGVIKSAFWPPDDRYRNRMTDSQFWLVPLRQAQ